MPDDVTRPQSDDALDETLEPRVGTYRLVRELGQGGMGTVFLAVRDDDEFHKRVAIKILTRGMDTDYIVRRFRTERQILAGLDHPNIARLLDGGTTADGRPYLVMEYVDGAPLVEYAERACSTPTRGSTLPAAGRRRCSTRTRTWSSTATSSRPTCWSPATACPSCSTSASPSCSSRDGRADAAPTAARAQLMTPEYASPEQVRGETVTTATDVYSLGVLLYELLTGRRPYRFTSRAVADIARVVCETEPIRPSLAIIAARRRPPMAPPSPGRAPAPVRPARSGCAAGSRAISTPSC